MKKLLTIFLLLTFFFIGVVLFGLPQKQTTSLPLTHKKTIPTPTIVMDVQKTILFVPYWTLGQTIISSEYNMLVYFGISANENGLDTKDTGYQNLHAFISQTKNTQAKKILTVRLLDQKTNEKILHDASLQTKIIDDSISIAKQYGFQAILLDLEYNALPFDSVLQSTTNFSKVFTQKVHKENMSFYQSIYGDEFYRSRPFDMQALGKIADGIFVMSYDLHKANGDPGPNFPIQSKEDYTFLQMTNDFLVQVPREKLFIIFGMYGYDWTVDSKGNTTGQAESVTLTEIQKDLLDNCEKEDCKNVKDSTHATKITYSENNQKHVIWIDSQDTIKEKIETLKKLGIVNIAYWANGYF